VITIQSITPRPGGDYGFRMISNRQTKGANNMAETDGHGYFNPNFDPDAYILEAAGMEGDPETKYPVHGRNVEALAVLAKQIGICVREQQKDQLEFIFRSFAELRKVADKYWTEMYGEDLSTEDDYQEPEYISYKHYPIESADKDHDQSQAKRFKVTTINWTFATENGLTDKSKVHKNEYDMSLSELIDFIRGTDEVAEDVISIEPMIDDE
jgi:hypothetical protein